MRTVYWKIESEIEAKMKVALKSGTKEHADKTILCSTAPVNSDIYKLIMVYAFCSVTQAAHTKEKKTLNSYTKKNHCPTYKSLQM